MGESGNGLVGGLRLKQFFILFLCHISLPHQGVKGWVWKLGISVAFSYKQSFKNALNVKVPIIV